MVKWRALFFLAHGATASKFQPSLVHSAQMGEAARKSRLFSRTGALPLLAGLAMWVNYLVPSLSTHGRPFQSEGMFFITFGTVMPVGRLTDPAIKTTFGNYFLSAAMIFAPFIYRALSISSSTDSAKSGFFAFFEAIYLSLPYLLIAAAFGLVPEVVARIRRTSTPRPAN